MSNNQDTFSGGTVDSDMIINFQMVFQEKDNTKNLNKKASVRLMEHR